MDLEKSGEVLDVSEPPQQEETVMEKEVVSKLETPEDSTEPEKPPAAGEETEQLPVNGHDTEVINLKETEELIVTGSVTMSEEKTEVEIEDSLPTEESEMESEPAAVAPPEPDESSEKISDPVAALDTEPENTQPQQQPAPENDPEPLLVQTPLADIPPELEPEKLSESVPEAEIQEQTSPEPAALQQLVDTEPPRQEETESELKGTDTTLMDTKAEEVANKVVEEKDVPAEPIKEVEKEKPAEEEESEEVSPEKPAVTVTVTEEAAAAEQKKEAEPEKGAGGAAEEKAVTPETNNAELQKEEETVPASGSLSFALLEQEPTKDALRTSRTLVVLRGLPGSGKSFLARAIADAYKDHCSVFCADDHGVKPESPEASADGYKALDEAVVACCSAGPASSVLVVVDDTNHTLDRLARLGEIAEQYHLVTVFLEPRTEWSRDLTQLTKKTRRGLEEAQLEAMRGPFTDVSLPLFFGWFLLSSVQDKVRCTSMDFLKTLDTMDAFKKHLIDFTGKAEKEVDLEQYFQAKGSLHCTTKFSDYGKADGAKEYAENPVVQKFYGSVSELSLSALFVTPRTVGARVSLTEEQLLLWPADAEKEADVPAAASLPQGSRAHVTLGCAEGVEPVQTGLDLLEILALQQEGQQGELVEEMELGSLTYYGNGRWLLSLRESICAPACFSSYYGRKEPGPPKKEPEKRKRQKCTIL
ncbi:'%2C3'-cyclic-nucleotide 3'-phosphodiesterase isoform X3 [Xyrichtys novacula]|uniref:2',3'-cyclic-nucleotide 3'-phosphodiesterase n=1 Tax=Xyrichtys novacula TaxID=13765 RepID=A0AAV1GRH9_XYRNO|nr:'%2C3'-cyclic-nucleotide 3'-phosphodiesterase isoform X3 [Xyrichtys novacula]